MAECSSGCPDVRRRSFGDPECAWFPDWERPAAPAHPGQVAQNQQSCRESRVGAVVAVADDFPGIGSPVELEVGKVEAVGQPRPVRVGVKRECSGVALVPVGAAAA